MIYFDNAATTKMSKLCLQSFEKYGIEQFYNPSALYAPSVQTRAAINNARKGLTELLGGDGTVVFTASGTEADNLALFGSKKFKNCKIVVSEIEHSAVFNCAAELKQRGYDIVYAPVDRDGRVNIQRLSDILDENVALVSIMHVSNETGAVNDLKTISKLIKQKSPRALFHSDGVQGFTKVNVNVKDFGVDMYSISAHKFHAPKGVGALYFRQGVNLSPVIFGGGQENGLRSATENVAGIDAFYQVAKQEIADFDKNYSKKRELIEYLRAQIVFNFSDAVIVSPLDSPHILTVAFKGVRGEVVLHALEKHGIIVGIGSACSSKKGISRIKNLLGLDAAHAEGTIRISISADNTKDEADMLISALKIEIDALKGFKRV